MSELVSCIPALVIVVAPFIVYGYIMQQQEKIKKLKAERDGKKYTPPDEWDQGVGEV